jgi:UDP-N-acetylglucosamine--N-acetylmuramyl-(pentapeptide) pyrophosphoryl-undecaprenol N-acetylglucosamine transferase
VVQAASLLGAYTLIQEQNEKPGLVTRLLARRADAVHLSFERSKRYFRNPANLFVSGNPTRTDLERQRNETLYRQFGLAPGKSTIFVFGGSQGAKSLNAAMERLALPLVEAGKAQVLWATGERWFTPIRTRFPEGDSRIRIFPYLHDMGSAYGVSDLVVCRSGASTVAEIARLGLAAVFVPFPGAAGGHQAANADVFSEAGAAITVPDGPDLAGRLRPVLEGLLEDSGARKGMAEAVRRFARPDAAAAIVDQLMKGLSCSKS